MRRFVLAALLFAVPALAQTPAADQPPADTVPVPLAVTPAPVNPPMGGPKLLISTAMGDITLQLDSTHAPKSVANVLKFVKARHYDGTVVYRVARAS